MSIRLFIALPVPEAVRHRLSLLQDEMRAQGVRASYVPQQNMHITLAFLGNRSRECAARIVQAFETMHMPSLDLTLDGTGHFGALEFVSLRQNPALSLLAQKVRARMAQETDGQDLRPFHPHITLARRCRPMPEPEPFDPVSFRVDHALLYQSVSTAKGVQYVEIARICADR